MHSESLVTSVDMDERPTEPRILRGFRNGFGALRRPATRYPGFTRNEGGAQPRAFASLGLFGYRSEWVVARVRCQYVLNRRKGSRHGVV